jgi:hypothetical protein
MPSGGWRAKSSETAMGRCGSCFPRPVSHGPIDPIEETDPEGHGFVRLNRLVFDIGRWITACASTI